MTAPGQKGNGYIWLRGRKTNDFQKLGFFSGDYTPLSQKSKYALFARTLTVAHGRGMLRFVRLFTGNRSQEIKDDADC